MSMQDTVADMLTRIRNAQQARKQTVAMPVSKLKVSLAKVLIDEGYLASSDVDGLTLTLGLKYYEGKPVIEQIGSVPRQAPSIPRRSKSRHFCVR